MPGPFTPNDTLVGSVMDAMGTIITTQIPSISKVYRFTTSRSVPDNQVKLIFNKLEIKDDTNGKIKMNIKITAKHLFRLAEYDAAIQRAQMYVEPWLQLLTAWPNQMLTGNMIVTNASDITLTQVPEAGQAMVALIINFDIMTEQNIILT